MVRILGKLKEGARLGRFVGNESWGGAGFCFGPNERIWFCRRVERGDAVNLYGRARLPCELSKSLEQVEHFAEYGFGRVGRGVVVKGWERNHFEKGGKAERLVGCGVNDFEEGSNQTPRGIEMIAGQTKGAPELEMRVGWSCGQEGL